MARPLLTPLIENHYSHQHPILQNVGNSLKKVYSINIEKQIRNYHTIYGMSHKSDDKFNVCMAEVFDTCTGSSKLANNTSFELELYSGEILVFGVVGGVRLIVMC